MTPEEIRAWQPFLKRVAMFSDLTAGELSGVASRMEVLSLPKGATLYSQGDEGDALYIITSGQVRLVNPQKGEDRLVALMGRGDALGETGILTGERRSMTVRLDTTCEFLKLGRKDFEAALRDSPSILMHLSRMISRRLVASTQPARRRSELGPQIVALHAALEPGDSLLFTLHLAVELLEQTRRRTLLVDMAPDAGAVARAMGLNATPATEAQIRSLEPHDPAAIGRITQQHASGLDILNLPAAVLGGRLYSGIYLFLNYLRETHDLILVSLPAELGDIERSVLSEVDRSILAGTRSRLAQCRRLEHDIAGVLGGAKRLQVWLGPPPEEEPPQPGGSTRVSLDWSPAILEVFERTGSPYAALQAHPKALRGISRLARSVGGVRVGFALGSGAALGYSLIGILKVLMREHIPIDMIAGTSIGGFVAAFVAMGVEPEQIEEVAVKVDRGWLRENLFWDLTLPRAGIFAGETFLRFIRSYFGDRLFSDLEIPCACIATDIETGEEVVLREGRVAESVRASCGLPIIFTPLRWNGRFLVDGGLVNPVPTGVVSEMGADIVVAVNLTRPAGERKSGVRDRRYKGGGLLGASVDLASLKDMALPDALRAPNLLEVLFQMVYTMEYEISRSRMDPAHVVIHPELSGFSWTEMHRARELIAAGERIAEAHLAKVKSLIPFFADYCTVPIRLAKPF